VHLEASTKPHIHQKFEIFWTNIKNLKNKKLFGCLSCPKNKTIVVLIHNSTTIYPIEMRLFAPRTLFVLHVS
jgi:hypothetical protein